MTTGRNIFRIILAIIFSTGLCLSSFAANLPGEGDGGDPIGELQSKTASIKITESGLEISNTDDENIEVYVYALTGKLVKQVNVASGTYTIELSPGFYIVKCGSITKRVAIK